MRHTVEITSMMAVVSPLFSENIGVMIIAVIITALFTYLIHKHNGRIGTN